MREAESRYRACLPKLFLIAQAQRVGGVGAEGRDAPEASPFIEAKGGVLVYAGFQAQQRDAEAEPAGDGVQEAFIDEPRVRVVSIHEQGRWPHSGAIIDLR